MTDFSESMLFAETDAEALPDIPKWALEILGVDNELTGATKAYADSHWLRLINTFQALKKVLKNDARNVVELGPAEFYSKTLRSLCPNAKFQYVGKPFLEEQTGDFFDVNLETDPLPFSKNSLDIVLAFEVIEHLFNDPMALFSEVNRCLRTGGVFVVTTPNIASYNGIRALLTHYAPFFYVKFSPDAPQWATHRREYTFRDLQEFGRAAGFSTEVHTFDSYKLGKDSILKDLLADLNLDTTLRGDTLFAAFTKQTDVVDRRPIWFYEN